MQSTIYHFSAAQKKFFQNRNETPFEILVEIIEKNNFSENNFEFSQEKSDKLRNFKLRFCEDFEKIAKEAIEIYGLEAAILAIFMNPILPGRKITLNKNDLLTGWKLMNKIFAFLKMNQNLKTNQKFLKNHQELEMAENSENPEKIDENFEVKNSKNFQTFQTKNCTKKIPQNQTENFSENDFQNQTEKIWKNFDPKINPNFAPKIEEYIKTGQKYKNLAKMHNFVAIIFHILKAGKGKFDLNLCNFIAFLEPILPIICHQVKNQKL